jgi:predicted dehydrogenase
MVRVGILGTARIARAFFADPLEGVEISAVASRTPERANQFADEFRISKRYGSYDALVADPEIDALYIPLPQHLHHEYVLKSARAGKHVLVEKPAALTVAELKQMLSECRQHRRVFMEAFMYRFMKLHQRAKEIVRTGTIGELRYIDFNFGFNILVRGFSGFRTERANGGGALYDLGIYGLDFIWYMTEGVPQLLQAFTHRAHPDEVDLFTHAVYKAGPAVVTMTCAFNTDANYYILSGEKGSIASPVGISGRKMSNTLRIHLLEGDKKYEEEFPPTNPYKAELEYFARCIEQAEEPFLGGANSLRNMELLEELLKNASVI